MIRKPPKRRREPTITLINVVFLMLVFFMVAGTLAQPLDREVALVRSADLDITPPPDALVIHPDGRLSFRGAPLDSATAYMQHLRQDGPAVARLVPDRDLPAARLVDLAAQLRQAGAERVVLITERGLE